MAEGQGESILILLGQPWIRIRIQESPNGPQRSQMFSLEDWTLLLELRSPY